MSLAIENDLAPTSVLNLINKYLEQEKVDEKVLLGDFLALASEVGGDFLPKTNSDGSFDRSDLDLPIILSIAGELLSRGKSVFLSAEILDNVSAKFIQIERVYLAHSEGNLNEYRKLVIKLASAPLESEGEPSYRLMEHPTVIAYDNSVSIENDTLEESNIAFKGMESSEIGEFYRCKQEIIDQVKDRRLKKHSLKTEPYAVALKDDYDAIVHAFKRVQERKPFSQNKVSRESHAYVKPFLHVLPRLFLPQEGLSRLQFITQQLNQVKDMGFDGVMLGVIDPQSTQLHYGENIDGRLVACNNNHGYWSSGEIGVDSTLGDTEDYLALAAESDRLGLNVTQDCIFGTLGYPAQLRRFSTGNIEDATNCLMVMGQETKIHDLKAFIQSGSIPNEDHLIEGVSIEDYADTVLENHTGTVFALPKLNLYDESVLAYMVSRCYWQIRDAGVTCFRIDMAKHVGTRQLRSIIGLLREESNKAIASKKSKTGVFRVLLEYWVVNYRDIVMASHGLEEQRDNVYFYDFPLAGAVYGIFANRQSFAENIAGLISEREKYDVSLCQMIPTFVDHDFNFLPLYTGTQTSSSMIAVGYALTFMLSANAPYVYFGYGKAEMGARDIDGLGSFTESHTRKEVSAIFAKHDNQSPENEVSRLLAALSEHAILSSDQSKVELVSGDDDSLVINRSVSGGEGAVRAHFFRGEINIDNLRHIAKENIIYQHTLGPSVIIEQLD